jgi:4'-phosphopantetheinyl transferase
MDIPPGFFELPDNLVHVLCLNISEHKDSLEAAAATLSPAERERAGRYANPWHGRRFAYTRGLLRTLLGRFLHRPPAGIEFAYGAYGKPALSGDGELNFNLSHSGDWVALGFALNRRIGIDLESVPACRRDCRSVARQCFSPRELAVLEEGMNAAEVFCSLWVRKEAVLKAAGRGLDLLQATCALDPVVALEDDRGSPIRWYLNEIPTLAGYAMALAAEGGPVRHVSFRL